MTLPLRQRNTTIEVVGELISRPYIGITLAMLRRFGVEIARDGWQRFGVPAAARFRSSRPSCFWAMPVPRSVR